MSFSHVLGQPTAIATLSRALQSGRVHHAYRFEGPDGVGKDRTAIAFAQAMLCAGGDALGCGRCDPCRRAISFSNERPRSPLHPDFRIVERGFYPPEVLGRRTEETAEISVDQVRTVVLSHAAFAPHEGRAKIFLVRRADELSIAAANALLKTLEEPHQGTSFILTSSRADRLLPTIRSRTLPIRFAPLSDAIVHQILTDHGVPSERQPLAVELAAGSASAALLLADADASAERDAFVRAALAAIAARDLGPAVSFAEAGDKDKGTLRVHLAALGAALAREARRGVAASPDAARTAAARYKAVEQALVQLDRNASPTLSVVSLIAEMQRAF